MYVPAGATTPAVTHDGIYYDGSLYEDRLDNSFLIGVRYNCSVCSDMDFCVNFKDSLANKHDRTHTPIKIENTNKNYTDGENSSGRESDQGRRREVIAKER